jgi:PhnB protein
MMTVNIYLTFDGNCREAFEFYGSVFKSDDLQFNTFSEMPEEEGVPPVSDELKDKIMHVTLPISKETSLMGSDTGDEWSQTFQKGNNFSISVSLDDTKEADRIFSELSKGGEVSMPLDKTFWDAYFGMLTDKFGINWIINCDLNPR